jgi:hypothetical protein
VTKEGFEEKLSGECRAEKEQKKNRNNKKYKKYKRRVGK